MLSNLAFQNNTSETLSDTTTYSNSIPATFFFGDTSIIVPIEMDAWIDEDEKNDNYGIAETLNLQLKSGEEYRVLIQNDLSSYNGWVLDSAKLFVYLEIGEGNGYSIDVHALGIPWDEGLQDGDRGLVNWKKQLRPLIGLQMEEIMIQRL